MLPPVLFFRPLLVLAALPLFALPAVPSRASSILVIEDRAQNMETASVRTESDVAANAAVIAAEPQRSASTPEACAALFHKQLVAISETEFAALKAAADAGSAAGDPRLPGMLLFAPTNTDGTPAERRAAKAAATLAHGRGASAVDGNGRWVLARLREDLGDYLGQKPSPFLCSGVANYVSTLRGFANGALPSPARRREDLETGQRVAEAALRNAVLALRPVPVPSAAPADRPAPSLDAPAAPGDLRPAIDGHEPDTQVAPGAASSPVEAGDPDLPPLPPAPALDTEADILKAIDGLVAKAEAAGQLGPAVAAPAAATSAAATPAPVAEEPAAANWEPVPARLAGLRSRLATGWSPSGDPLARARVETALGNLEALDYLRRAAADDGDPLAAALERVFTAIEAAHASAAAGGGAMTSVSAPNN